MPIGWPGWNDPLLGDQPIPGGIPGTPGPGMGTGSGAPPSTPATSAAPAGYTPSAPTSGSSSGAMAPPASLPQSFMGSQPPTAAFQYAGPMPPPADEPEWELKCGAYEVWVTVTWGQRKPTIKVNGMGPHSCKPRMKGTKVDIQLPRRGLNKQSVENIGKRTLRLKFERVAPVQESTGNSVTISGSLEHGGRRQGLGDAYKGSSFEFHDGKNSSGPLSYPSEKTPPKPSGDSVVLPVPIAADNITLLQINLDFGDAGEGGGDRPKPKEEPRSSEAPAKRPRIPSPFYNNLDPGGMAEGGLADDPYADKTDSVDLGQEAFEDSWPGLFDGEGASATRVSSHDGLTYVLPGKGDSVALHGTENCSNQAPWTFLDVCIDPLSEDSQEAVRRSRVNGSRIVPPVQNGAENATRIHP